MASIGGYNFINLKGVVDLANGEQLEDITRRGVNGVSFRRVGKKSEPFLMTSVVDVASNIGADSLIYEYKNIMGSLVNLVDETNINFTNIAVLNVTPREIKYSPMIIGGLSGYNNGWLVTVDWQLQATNY